MWTLLLLAGLILGTDLLRSAEAMAQDQPVAVMPNDNANVPADGKGRADAPASRTDLTIGWKQIRELFGFSVESLPMWALVVCSILTISFAFERVVALQARRVSPHAFVSRFLQRLKEGDLDNAKAHELLQVCHENDSPIAHFFAIVLENRGRSAVEIRVNVSDIADNELFHLRKHIRAISGLAMLAPLLGLFGTVIGMIKAFHALSQTSGVGKTEMLAHGISLALIATASGLAVAIAASVFFYYLQGRVDQRIQEMDLFTNQAVMLVASDGRPREPERKVRRPLPIETKTA